MPYTLDGFDKGDVTLGQCKQCGGPVTDHKRVDSEWGVFCSTRCLNRYHEFAVRAADFMNAKKPGVNWGFMVIRLIRSIIALVILVAAVGYITTEWVDIPIITELFDKLRESLQL